MELECSLCSEELMERRETLLAELAAAAVERGEIDGGVFLELPGDERYADLVARFVSAERQCCRFLRFTLTYSPDLGPIRIEVTGPPGTGEFLRTVAGIS